jgi:cobalt/nickel transport system ATP-binding protein
MPTVLEDVAFGPLAAGWPAAEATERARAALDRTGILKQADKAPWHLSAGEKKRAALAGILATEPKLLVLDEPTTFLDPPGRRALGNLLASLPQSKILVTHDPSFARGLTDDGAFFQKGTIAARGPIAEIVQRFGW